MSDSETDAIRLKTKKRVLAIDSDGEEAVKTVATKTQEEKTERENYDHKKNGEKPAEGKKKEEAKQAAKSDVKKEQAKPKPPADKDNKTSAQKNTDQKPAVKPKPVPTSSEKKVEANGQSQKKAPEEKKTPTKPPQKPVNKKKEESEDGSEGSAEETDSESDESDSESESEDEKPKRKPKQKSSSSVKKSKPKKDSKPEAKKVLKPKDVLVYDVLKRWWYCMPDWPPAGYDYNAELAKHKLRRVDAKYWKIEPETDANGFRKVQEVQSFTGVFKNSKGEIIDLRPKDSCPSYENFRNKSILELCELLVKALKGQIEALEKSSHIDKELLGQLKRELNRAEKSYEAQKNRK